MPYRTLDIGNKVYIFKDKEDLSERIKEGRLIPGEVVSYHLSEDLSYNVCECRVYIYDVKHENGKVIEGMHRDEYFGWCILKTKDEVINEIDHYISYNNYLIEEKCKELNKENDSLKRIKEELDKKVLTKKKVK